MTEPDGLIVVDPDALLAISARLTQLGALTTPDLPDVDPLQSTAVTPILADVAATCRRQIDSLRAGFDAVRAQLDQARAAYAAAEDGAIR